MNWKTESKKLPQSEEGKMDEKIYIASGAYVTIRKYLIFVSLEPKRE